MATPLPPTGSVLLNIRLVSSSLHKALCANKIRVIPEYALALVDIVISQSKTVMYVSNNELSSDFDSCRKKITKFSKLSNKGIILFEMTDAAGDEDFIKLQKVVVIDLRLKLLPFYSHEDAAILISHLISEEAEPKYNPFLIKKKPDPMDPLIVSSLQQIPRLGAVKVKTLLQNYNNIANIAQASEEELGLLIGKVCAKSIRAFFHAKTD